MKTSGITAALPAQDMARARAFYIDKVGLQAVESDFLKASDGRVGAMVGDGINQLFVYPAHAQSSGEFTQVVIQVADVRAAVEEMRRRGVEFEEYDTPETRTENGIARMPMEARERGSRTQRATSSASYPAWPANRGNSAAHCPVTGLPEAQAVWSIYGATGGKRRQSVAGAPAAETAYTSQIHCR